MLLRTALLLLMSLLSLPSLAEGGFITRLLHKPVPGGVAVIGLPEQPQAPRASFNGQPVLVLREDGSRTRSKLEQAAALAGVALSPAIVAEGREAVREIVAAGGGIGFVSLAEFGEDRRLARIALAETPPMEMDETLICLPERRDTKLVAAFMDLARSMGTAPA